MAPFSSEAQRRYLFAKEPAVAKEFAAATPKGAKLPEKVQTFSRNEKVIPKREKIHPAVTQAMQSFANLHGGKFAANAGRGFKKKS